MQNVSRKIFYSGLLRFQLILFSITILPLLVLKVLFLIYPNDISWMINMLIFAAFALCIIGGSFYMLTHFSSVDKNLKPIARMAEVGEMASKVAHDLRGPLSGIHAVIDLLQQNAGKKDFSNIMNLLELSSRRLEHVADDLLKKYKGQDESVTRFNLHEVLDELAGEYTAQPELQEVHFKKTYWHDAIWIEGKRNRLQRAFGNLIKNALEAIAFSGQIFIKTELKNERILIIIKDTGPGMTSEKGAKLLHEGFSEGKKDGNGIGVAFVREIVAEHKGILSLETAPGTGCAFHIDIPFITSVVSEIFEIVTEEKKSVVVIDDDCTLLEQWRLVLEGQGIKAETYTCYEEFEKRSAHPELVEGTAIIDYHFENSELNGIEIIKKFKEQGFENLYLCTAEYWKPSLKKQAQELGISICPKPLPKIVVRESGIVDHSGVIASEAKQSSSIHGIASSPAAPRNDKRGYTVLVIDDDSVIRLSWEMMSEKLHVETLHAFASLESLQTANIDLKTIDIAFVDKNIENSAFDGAQVIDFLKIKGVSKVVLASGENEEELREDPKFAQADFVISTKVPTSFKAFLS